MSYLLGGRGLETRRGRLRKTGISVTPKNNFILPAFDQVLLSRVVVASMSVDPTRKIRGHWRCVKPDQ